MPQPPGDSPLEVLTIRVPAETIRTLDEFSQGASRAVTGRTFLEFGIQQLTKPGALEALELHHQLGRLEAIAASFPAGRTSSGAPWLPTLPDPEQIASLQLPAVVAVREPNAVMLLDYSGQSLVIGFGADAEVVATPSNGKTHRAEVALGTIVTMAGQLGAAVVELANAGPGRTARLHAGLELARLASGDVSVRFGPLAMVIPARLMWVWLAELNAAIARQLGSSLEARQQLEAQLQASPGQEVKR
jgi:hypothetical protein